MRLELAFFSARGVSVHPLTPGLTLHVGRGDDADIAIDDVAVSRRHATFHGGPPLEVEDLDSANGTFMSPAAPSTAEGITKSVERRRVVGRMALAEGDVVHFGAASVVVRAVRAPAAPPAPSFDRFDAVIRAPAVVKVYEEAVRVAPMSLPVLILGETGVGKDLLACFIHRKSPRAKGPFVALNCASITESLAESELFGHEKGAFTGAQKARAGLFESAEGGTVFLDEIGELPLSAQAKLLRTLESSEVHRLGSSRPIKVNVRFVSATNRDLGRASAQGQFREDLFFRVNGIALRLPPLRERVSDIGELARHFLDAARGQVGLTTSPTISDEALAALETYAWPGNIRELRFVMERTLVTAGAGPILPVHLPPQVLASNASPALSSKDDFATRAQVIDALARCDGNQTHAAELLGVSRRTLINRMIEFGLPRPRKG